MKKIIGILLILSVLSAFFKGISVSAEETPSTSSRASCVKDHFDDLSYNWGATSVPENVQGSCTFVAMSMLFSFYDSYWNDDFVANSLEWNQGLYDISADRLIKTFNSNTEYNTWENYSGSYEEYLLDYQSSFLHNYLISIGQSKSYVPNEDGSYGLSFAQLVDMVETYIYEIRRFNRNQVEVKYSQGSDAELFEIMKMQIDLGFPVIYTGFKGSEGTEMTSVTSYNSEAKVGHAMIAYDYVEENGNNDTKLFRGYNYPAMFTWTSTTEYNKSNAIIWLEIKDALPHECTNNYYDVHTKESICACKIYYNTHPAHLKNHFYILDKYDINTHFKECYCGEKIDVNYHNLTYQCIDDTIHTVQCEECTYTASINHTYNYAVYLSDTSHRLDCVCGHQGEEIMEHSPASYTIINNMRHNIYCSCGSFIGTGTHSMVTQGRYATCVQCGVVVDTFSDVTIKWIDDKNNKETE